MGNQERELVNKDENAVKKQKGAGHEIRTEHKWHYRRSPYQKVDSTVSERL